MKRKVIECERKLLHGRNLIKVLLMRGKILNLGQKKKKKGNVWQK